MIYALTDPTKENAIRYVGYTGCRKYNRLWFHLNSALLNSKRTSHRSKWVYGLLKKNLIPGFEILEKGTGDWEERERHWIKALREQGADLVNVSDGGRGTYTVVPPERSPVEKRTEYFKNHCAMFVGKDRSVGRAEVKSCEQCGKLFFSKLLRGIATSKCCSYSCSARMKFYSGKGNRKPISLDEPTVIIAGKRQRAEKCICPYCKVEFLGESAKVRRGTGGPYCSIPCAKKHHWWLGKMTPKRKGMVATA